MDILYVGQAFWLTEVAAIDGDPLELMIQCEEEDARSHKDRGSTYHEYSEKYRTTH